jgi:hypothetical protein
MEQHAHTWYGWLNHHWAFISLVCFPAAMGYLNGFAAFTRVMGWDKLSAWLSKFEDACKAFVANAKSQSNTTKGV